MDAGAVKLQVQAVKVKDAAGNWTWYEEAVVDIDPTVHDVYAGTDILDESPYDAT